MSWARMAKNGQLARKSKTVATNFKQSTLAHLPAVWSENLVTWLFEDGLADDQARVDGGHQKMDQNRLHSVGV